MPNMNFLNMNFLGPFSRERKSREREWGKGEGERTGRKEEESFAFATPSLAVCAVAMSPHRARYCSCQRFPASRDLPVSHTIFVSCCAGGAPHKRKPQTANRPTRKGGWYAADVTELGVHVQYPGALNWHLDSIFTMETDGTVITVFCITY